MTRGEGEGEGRERRMFVCQAVICTYREKKRLRQKKHPQQNNARRRRKKTRKIERGTERERERALEIYIFACSFFSRVVFCSLWGLYTYILYLIYI